MIINTVRVAILCGGGGGWGWGGGGGGGGGGGLLIYFTHIFHDW